jgi:hypothetical protein
VAHGFVDMVAFCVALTPGAQSFRFQLSADPNALA